MTLISTKVESRAFSLVAIILVCMIKHYVIRSDYENICVLFDLIFYLEELFNNMKCMYTR